MRQTPNSERQPVKIAGGSTFGRYPKISSAKTYNMFVSDNWLINTGGYQRIYDLLPQSTTNTGAQGRALFNSIRGDILLAVTGASVFSIDTNLNPTLIGTLATERGAVFIDENLNSQICIVDGVNAYIYNYSLPSPNLTVQSVSSLIPNYVCYHNTYFLFGNNDRTTNGAAWYAYQYDTATTITESTPGQFALQTKPDFALAIVRLPSQSANVLVFGSTVCEIWTQVGGLQNYRRNSTVSVDYGCLAVDTISYSDRLIMWLAVSEKDAAIIMAYTGQGFEQLSTDGIDYQLSQLQYPSEATAMFFRQDGHLFYQLTFYNPADNLTILYDVNTKMFLNLSDANLNYHPAREYAFFNNELYFISVNNASLYQSSTNFTTYNENLPTITQDPTKNLEIPRIRICDTVRAEDSGQFRANTFSFTIEQGTDEAVSGLSLLNNVDYIVTEDAFVFPNVMILTEYGIPIVDEDSGAGVGAGDLSPPYQPRVDLSISRDGGYTWSNTVARNLNAVGYRQNIINWENLGSSNSLTIKIRFWGMSRFIAINGYIEGY